MRGKASFGRISPVYRLALLFSLAGSISLFSTVPTGSQAQVAPITSSGLNTQVSGPISVNGSTQYNITGGTRPGNGPNLFHSFGEFGVPSNNIANFLNTPVNGSLPATANILGRVTGGNPSNIFGTIRTTDFGNANLFLMNPAGILFGPTASLNVGGSVAFTTANYLRLTDGARFNAVPNAAADALLSAAPVAAFGFLGSNPGAITVMGSQLSVSTGQGISLVGGNIIVQNGTLENGTVQAGRLSAPNGQINLAAAASPGEFLLQGLQANSLAQPASGPNVNGASFTSFGSVHLAQGSTVNVGETGNGKLSIRGGQFVLEIQNVLLSTVDSSTPVTALAGQDNITLGPGSSIVTATSSTDRGAELQMNANRIEIVGIPFLPPTPQTPTIIRSQTSAGGRGGDITLEADSILVKNFGQLQSTTQGTGDGGNINVTAHQNLQFVNGLITAVSQNSSGNAGDINLTSTHGNIVLSGGNPVPFGNTILPAPTSITSQTLQSTGTAGSIRVNAPEGDVLLADTAIVSAIRPPVGQTVKTEGGGKVQVTANNLQFLSGVTFSSIQVDNFSTLKPGDFTMTLNGNLTLGGNSRIITTSRGPAAAANLNITAHDILITQGSLLSTDATRSGPGGQLNISTESLQVTSGGQLRSGSTISASGAGGTINIQGLDSPASSIVIDGPGSGITTNAEGTGTGGTINLSAQSLTIQNGGTISAKTSGTAPSATGGNIAISADQSVTLNNGGSITASSTGPANAGNIVINAGQNYTSTNSNVTTEAAKASGGNITVLATDTVQLTNSQINASVQGSSTTIGGNIVIDPQFVILQNSQILARATQGAGGNITITTNTFLPDANSVVSASSDFGVNGTVTIQSPTAPLSGQIRVLPQNTVQASSLLRQRCAAQLNGQSSSFVMAGRDSLPVEPGTWLASLATTDAADAALVEDGRGFQAGGMISSDAAGTVSLRRMNRTDLFAQALVGEGTTGCGS